MSIFVILGLLVCIKAQGSSVVTPVFVKKGEDVLLNVTKAYKEVLLVNWKFNEAGILSFFPNRKPTVSPGYTGRIEFSETNYSMKLKNLQKTDSGFYTALVFRGADPEKTEHTVTVQDPVSPVELSVDSVVINSDSCNFTVTCRTQDSHINSTIRCDTQTCSQDGGEQSKVTTSGAFLKAYLANDSIICNHSNQVSWTEDMKIIEHFCPQHAGSETDSAHINVCLVKTVVFSVGLFIMVSAVITVHLMEKLKKTK
ncbi:T-lymphocyte surface antigen Ly-9-like [Centropristis striata]|uniref:T-lymphocyte surface antigen Ly-9-like n=1 Tax=Centropristis striata TaxID=184440 RepID=UPI0027E1FA85|nr:T-lymphocyte surface antigen Ly-9-like [Centropristis striata]